METYKVHILPLAFVGGSHKKLVVSAKPAGEMRSKTDVLNLKHFDVLF